MASDNLSQASWFKGVLSPVRLKANSTDKIRKLICLPEGTVGFEYVFNVLFDKSNAGFLIFEMASEQQFFRIDRTAAFEVNYVEKHRLNLRHYR